MPICTHCTYPVPYLYTLYQSVNNLRLEQCPGCLAFTDPYVEHDPLTLFLDLILLKREVYRHLLFNRDCEPRHSGTSSSANPRQASYKSRVLRSWQLVVQLGIPLVLIDAFVRWRDLSKSSSSFVQVIAACLLDTIAFHVGVAAGCVILSHLLYYYNRVSNYGIPSTIGTRLEFQVVLVPLTLFYSSFAKIFLLLLLSIWQSPIPSEPTNFVETGLGLPRILVRHQLVIRALSVLDENHFDRAWVIRNVLGGMSAGFGLRVLLDCHPVLTTLVVLFGWMVKSLAAQPISVWTGVTMVSEYSIP